jgi:hypothetical protein
MNWVNSTVVNIRLGPKVYLNHACVSALDTTLFPKRLQQFLNLIPSNYSFNFIYYMCHSKDCQLVPMAGTLYHLAGTTHTRLAPVMWCRVQCKVPGFGQKTRRYPCTPHKYLLTPIGPWGPQRRRQGDWGLTWKPSFGGLLCRAPPPRQGSLALQRERNVSS